MNRLSKSLALSVLIAAGLIAFGNAQGRPDPFFDHGDNGEIIRVLPTPASIHSPHDTQPTDAPPSSETAVYPASYGSGLLIDHGGTEIAGAQFMAIYWNTAVSNSTQTSLGWGTIEQQIDAFINAFGNNSNDYAIVQQYGSHAAIATNLVNVGIYPDNQPTSRRITDSSIQSYLAGLFKNGRLKPDTHTIYGIYFPPGMRVSLQGGSSCTNFCGYHSHFSYNGMQIKYASFPYLNCAGCSLAGKSVADMLTMVTSHEIREAVTDPGDNNVNAWYDSAGYEADDKCAWHNLYQMTNGGFWVQPEFSNGGTVTRFGVTATYPGPGCVVPQ